MAREVTAVTGKEPQHWHDADGRHRMADPRTTSDVPERWWDMDERAYVTHLQTHEGEKRDPVRNSEDSRVVRSLFDLLEARCEEIEKIRELITAHRELQAARMRINKHGV